MAQLFTQEIFELKPLIKSIGIKVCAQNRNGVKQILALVTEDYDIALHYCYGELPPVVKRIPWISDSSKQIQAVCFDPTATWLLAACLDSSLYIIPALYIVDKKQKIDCKWSLTDITAFPKSSETTNALPTCCVWWQTLECNQNALIGFDSGKILLVSLTDGRVLGRCHIPERVRQLHVCLDNVKETVSLLVNSDSERQWRLVLEHHSNGYTWPTDISSSNTEESVKSKFNTLKQIGVDTFFSFRQRLGNSRKDSQSDSASDSSFSELVLSATSLNEDTVSTCQSAASASADLNGSLKSYGSKHSNDVHLSSSEPELMPHFVDTFFTPQSCRNRSFFSALYRPTGLLTIHAADFETAPVFVYRVLPRTHCLILTDNLIYTLNRDINVISVISCQLAESRLEGETEFNEDSLVAQFMIDNEEIIDFFKVIDMSLDVTSHKNNLKNKFLNHKNKGDASFLKPAIDTCIIVTTKTVYKISVRYQPVQRFIDCVTEENDLEKAEKLSYIFNLNLQQLLEHCGDLLISRGSYHSGIILYKQAKVHLLKRVLKLSVSSDCKTLLKFVHLCLSASRIDMNLTTRIHIGNVAVMAYVELLLRSTNSEQIKGNNTKDFMNFLVHDAHFDPILAVNMTCQAGHWNIVNLLSKSRGLSTETVVAFTKILMNDFYPRPSNLDFLYALSEPTLTQSLLTLPHCSQIIFEYIRENVDCFPLEILKRLTIQLDPSQPCAIPFMKAIFQSTTTSYSATDTNVESFDYETIDSRTVVMKDLVETFLYVILSLTGRFDSSSFRSFDIRLLDLMVPVISEELIDVIDVLPELKMLSCGYEHAAVIRNNCVFTMGVATSGCLGTGPMLTNTSGPRLINTLHELKVTPLSVSCGRKHTLCATDSGVFAWGSNSYGQLGLGPHLQDTPYPQVIKAISHLKIIDIFAGQYHSIALTHSGKVYTWGWGIHGQLGHGRSDNEYYPRLVEFDHPVKQVAAGHAHSLVLTCEGKVYGFGSNAFAQLDSNSPIDSKKITRPTWIVLMPDMYVPVEKIATAYFHNMAVTADQKVFMWGASPEEIRSFQQRSSQRQHNASSEIHCETWKSTVQMYYSRTRRPIRQISVGQRHCAILDQGRILWGKNKDEVLCQPNVRDHYEGNMGHRFTHVSCGLDYTMAIDQNGQVLAWGTPAMIETILGVSVDKIKKKQDERAMILKGTRRTYKSPHEHPISNNIPIEITVLPSMAFTFNQTNHKALLCNKVLPFNVLMPDNPDRSKFLKEQKVTQKQDFSHIYSLPNVLIGQKTVHYALQTFIDLYDVENILKKCIEYKNFQAASKVSLFHGHYVDSLGFVIQAFENHISQSEIDLASLFTCKDSYDIKEKDQGIEIIVKTIKTELDKEKSSSCSSPAKILSSSSSLDSLKQFGEEGGQESPCEFDVRQNITNYVHSLKKYDSSVPKLNESYKDLLLEKSIRKQELQIKNKQAREVLDLASGIVEFYIGKIYISENHILMQNILLKCIEFWLSHNLPVLLLENIFLKNLDKYFYPLSILLFCKNFDDEDRILQKDDDIIQISSSGFLKEFSTKFCLHLCLMVLENGNKS
ncbi:unnamed protein product [Ceutorhynchus assimilis]|uniref:RCC1-like domain-containing protein n=1 Tax=Ceutorhynchus assimilis TaxID=467358 RepID=A0A9N9MI55_9CUCU|nr:unnamed protein product [Ceutorhynchus assimilis]